MVCFPAEAPDFGYRRIIWHRRVACALREDEIAVNRSEQRAMALVLPEPEIIDAV
jgi:hypothetical protein